MKARKAERDITRDEPDPPHSVLRTPRFCAAWPVVTFRQRPDFTITAASDNFAALTGVAPAEWESRPGLFWQLVHEADAPCLRDQIAALPGSPQGITTSYRLRHAHTGRLVQIWEHRTVSANADAPAAHDVTWVDVTAEAIAERRLRDAAWKEALGTAVAGLAHDFNNVMAGVCSMSESLLAQPEVRDSFRDRLTLIKKNSLEASRLLQQLVRWHRIPTGERTFLDLNQVVTDLQGLLRRIISRRIEVNVDLAPGSLPLCADAGELQRAILQLVVNAVEAMPGSGRLFLRTARQLQPPAPAPGRGAPPLPPLISLTVEDSGAGIAAAHLEDVFNPFFTTKPGRRGMGLGLHDAALFAAAHAGRITVESTPGKGSTLRLWLPEANLDDPAANASRTGAGILRPAVLLVHPDRPALDEYTHFLRNHGYSVAALDSVPRAWECLVAGDEDFAALIVLATPLDDDLAQLLADVRRVQPSLKLALSQPTPTAGNDAPAPPRPADLVLASDLPASGLAAQLDALLGRDRAAGE
jgi:signal transduction histidine kinase